MKVKFSLLLLSLLFGIIFIQSCKKDDDAESEEPAGPPVGTSFMEPSVQRAGNSAVGYDYLINGDYVDAGIPYDLYLTIFGEDNNNLLNRSGDNALLSPDFTALNAPNGVRVVAANCLQCHAQKINGELIVGLGNSVADFTTDQSALVSTLDLAVQFTYGAGSPEEAAYQPFGRALTAIGPHVVAPMRGLNPAAKLSVVLAAHRDINDLIWQESPLMPIPDETITSDVPPWWILKKKNAMFYSGGGKGDFSRIMMASSLLTLKDSTKARIVDQKFVDVLAYINSIEAPEYPEATDTDKVVRGQVIFENNCQACHGSYGVDETYPNLLVSLDKIGTDPLLASSNYTDGGFQDWYNNSWFSVFPSAASFTPEDGYVAPPLDGVWASAPYLHNGSVPNLETLLNSTLRPVYWERSFNTSDYDFEKVGWNYEVRTEATSTNIYDTSIPGYGNNGHNFGDGLSDDDRSDLIEYLKTI